VGLVGMKGDMQHSQNGNLSTVRQRRFFLGTMGIKTRNLITSVWAF
jgi:hypothetical protein